MMDLDLEILRMIGDNHFKCGRDDTTVACLHLFLRFSHGFVNKRNAMLAPFKHILLDLIVLPATDESLCTTGPPFQTLHFSLDKTIEGTSIYIFYDLSPYPPYPQTP